jgi:hypothetical protein
VEEMILALSPEGSAGASLKMMKEGNGMVHVA